jgi:two-component system, chemotaxis family, sensor histidine kinase and response regulator PixL
MASAAGASSASSSPSNAAPDSSFRQSFDTLEFDHYNDAHLPFRQIVESVVKLQEVADDIELSVDKTEQTTRVIHRTARHLQLNLNQMRMRPLSDVTNRFPRALRELALTHGKSVELALEGENILVDRNILEAMNDPLMHIVRNAFDHGIETPQQREAQGKNRTGTIAIKAFNRSNRTVITVSDDGNGIGLNKIRDRALSMGLDAELLDAASESELLSLIFEPGFSTSDEVTALSGRGVGMDVVRNNLTQIRGDISVDTEPGKGTTFTISVPYTLSVTRVMLAESNRMTVAIPTDFIEEVTVVSAVDLFESEGGDMFHFKGDAIRLIRLSNWITFNCTRQFDGLEEVPTMDRASVLLFRMGDQRVGIEIDRSWGEREVAVRRVEGPIALPAGFSNCTILGDGKVIPLISLPDFARWVLNCEASNISSAAALYSNPVMQGAIDPVSLQTMPTQNVRARFLVIDDSVNVRRLLALTLEKAGYEVEQARDGQDALDKLNDGMAIDGIVCDVEMPRMDGYSFLSKLRSHTQFTHIPVTMLTSRSGEKHRTLAMNLGATAYFSKPYQERVLLKSLEASLVAAAEKREQAAE